MGKRVRKPFTEAQEARIRMLFAETSAPKVKPLPPQPGPVQYIPDASPYCQKSLFNSYIGFDEPSQLKAEMRRNAASHCARSLKVVKHAMRHMVVSFRQVSSSEYTVDIPFKNRMQISVTFTDMTACLAFTRKDGQLVRDVYTDMEQLNANITGCVMFYCLR